MADDFFADLLPLKAKKAEQKTHEDPSPESKILKSNASPEKTTNTPTLPSYQEVGDLLGSDVKDEIPEDFAGSKQDPAEEDAAASDEQAALVEKVVHAALHKFANALQPILASMTRQMDELGSKVDKITSTLHASQTSSKQNDAILEHLSSLENGMKLLQTSVKDVIERQESAENAARAKEAEDKKSAEASKVKTAPAAPQPAKATVAEPISPAPSLITNPSAVLPPGPSLPIPNVPPLPATAPPATPIEPVPTPQLLQQPVPAEASQDLQRYGSTASSVSQTASGFAFGVPQQHQLPQNPFVSAPQQPMTNFSPIPFPRAAQPSIPPRQQQQQPLAPQTPPGYTAPTGQQASGQQYQQPVPQFVSAAPQTFPLPFQPGQQPNRQFYSQGQQPQPASQDPYAGSYGAPARPPSTGQNYGSQSGGGPGSGPASHQPTRYPSSGAGFTAYPPREFRQQSYGGGPRPEPQRQQSPQSVPLEKVVDDIANMGFSRHDARAVIQELQDKGQAVDLNVVLDRLMNGPRR